MDTAITAILVAITSAPAPVVPSAVAGIDDLDGNGAAGAHAVVVGVRACRAELVAGAACGAAVGLAAAVELACEELLVHGAAVDAAAAGPLPAGLRAVAGGAHPAVVLVLVVSCCFFSRD